MLIQTAAGTLLRQDTRRLPVHPLPQTITRLERDIVLRTSTSSESPLHMDTRRVRLSLFLTSTNTQHSPPAIVPAAVWPPVPRTGRSAEAVFPVVTVYGKAQGPTRASLPLLPLPSPSHQSVLTPDRHQLHRLVLRSRRMHQRRAQRPKVPDRAISIQPRRHCHPHR